MKYAYRYLNALSSTAFIGLLLVFWYEARAQVTYPLRALDASSPRATLHGFIEITDDIYGRLADMLKDYAESGRLYPSHEERQKQADALGKAPIAVRSLDVSRISPVLRDIVAIERVLQLKEILDRIEIPMFADIPTREAMTRLSSKRWRLPNTEIDLVLIEDGPRSGEYLVSAETVDRLPEFYERVKTLPYKPGPGKRLNDVYISLSSGEVSTIYEAYLSSPGGLSRIIPPRWLLNSPDWARKRIGGATTWQWVGLCLGLGVVGLFILGAHRLAHRYARDAEDESGARWHALLTPLAVVLASAFLAPFLAKFLHIGATPHVIMVFVSNSVFFLSAAWLSIVGFVILGEMIAGSEHLKRRSLDNQLARLGTRLAGIVVAVGILIQGAAELGFPAYSVLAGLGVGGLAVALAARETLANLLGSMLIMLEKPFRVGHVIRVSGTEGTVEDVGFRSTRIRTPDNSLISIPSNAVINATIENLSLRPMRRQRFFVQITYNTPREKVEALVAGIRQLMADHSLTNKTNFQVRFNNFSESSLDILVQFHLDVGDITTELEERERILLQIMNLTKELGIEFAFPTRTLYVESSLPAI